MSEVNTMKRDDSDLNKYNTLGLPILLLMGVVGLLGVILTLVFYYFI